MYKFKQDAQILTLMKKNKCKKFDIYIWRSKLLGNYDVPNQIWKLVIGR